MIQKRILATALLCFMLCGCDSLPSSEKEEVTARFPTGEPRESVVTRGKSPNIAKIKSFEYYLSGQRKREYEYRDNNYFGQWRYWYRDGKLLAEGTITEKTMDPHTGKGTATYFWPDGRKMIFIDNRPERPFSTVDYFDVSGNRYTDTTLPRDLKEQIVLTIFRWDKGEI